MLVLEAGDSGDAVTAQISAFFLSFFFVLPFSTRLDSPAGPIITPSLERHTITLMKLCLRRMLGIGC